MARIRTIKPEFFRHEELFMAEKKTNLPLRVAFAGLFVVADREGRFKWKPNQIKIDVLPWDDVDFEKVLESLITFGFIRKYEVDGKLYGIIPSFKEHQNINNRESKSVLPCEPRVTHASNTREIRVTHAASGEGKGREGKGIKYIQVCDAIAGILGKRYIADPQDRLPATANQQKEFEIQADRLLTEFDHDDAIKQIAAYLKHCSETNRKLVGTTFKIADTILESDWVKLTSAPTASQSPRFLESEYDKSMLTQKAWEDKYSFWLETDIEFCKHFGYDKLRSSSPMDGYVKSR